MKTELMDIHGIPAVSYGDGSDKLYLYVHGRYSRKEEAKRFAEKVVPRGYQVVSFDLPEHGQREGESYSCTAEHGSKDLRTVYSHIADRYKSISLCATSLGAYFSLLAFQNNNLDRCLFISPLLDMEHVIRTMMIWAKVSESELQERGEIETSFGELLSWDYYTYVKRHRIDRWNHDTYILYGENDSITERTVLDSFTERFHCKVTLIENGEHYFQGEEQLKIVSDWLDRVS